MSGSVHVWNLHCHLPCNETLVKERLRSSLIPHRTGDAALPVNLSGFISDAVVESLIRTERELWVAIRKSVLVGEKVQMISMCCRKYKMLKGDI